MPRTTTKSPSPTLDAPSTATISIVVAAPIDTVWEHICDPDRYRDWSPESIGADATNPLAVGTRFVGHNAREGNEWTVECEVVDHDVPTRFAFHAGDDEVGTTWRFTLRDLGEAGTQVSQSFDSLRLRHPDWIDRIPGRHGQLVEDMQTTLAALKTAAEEVAS